MALCLIAHLAVNTGMSSIGKRLDMTAQEMMSYFLQHPYLELDPEISKQLFDDEAAEEQFYSMLDQLNPQLPEKDILAGEQEELDLLMADVLEILNEIPIRKWGLIPSQKSLTTLLSHMFLHAGWMHLFGNLFMFYLCGPFIEDVWGRLIYLSFYLIGGIFSALVYASRFPDSTIPLIGASGAISACMGAFLVRHFKIRIKFFYWVFFFFRGTFYAPTWIMLPIWFLLELFNAKVMDAVGAVGGGGVAHWAHIAGFICGVLVALGMKFFKAEERYVAPKLEVRTNITDKSYTLFEEAQQMLKEGKKEDAFVKLVTAVREKPGDPDVVESLWWLASDLNRLNIALPFYKRLMESRIRKGILPLAMQQYDQMRSYFPQESLPDAMLLECAGYLIQNEEKKEACHFFEQISSEFLQQAPQGHLMKYLGIAMVLDVDKAQRVIPILETRHRLPPAELDLYKKKLYDMRAKTVKTLKIFPCLPLGISDGKLILQIVGSERKEIELKRIRVLSVAQIQNAAPKPILYADLLLDEIEGTSEIIRVIRFQSNQINNMRTLFPQAVSISDAWQQFFLTIIKSGAVKLIPDENGVLLKKAVLYSSLEEYETRVFKIV